MAVLEASALCLWRGKEGLCSTATNPTGPKMQSGEAFHLSFCWSAERDPGLARESRGSGQESALMTSSPDC